MNERDRAYTEAKDQLAHVIGEGVIAQAEARVDQTRLDLIDEVGQIGADAILCTTWLQKCLWRWEGEDDGKRVVRTVHSGTINLGTEMCNNVQNGRRCSGYETKTTVKIFDVAKDVVGPEA